MSLLTKSTSIALWQDVVKEAENRCSILLKEDIEVYLIAILTRYMNRPEIAQKVFATAFLDALHLRKNEREFSLQEVGDQCLLYAGFFPQAAIKRQVKVKYFVDIGRAAYITISRTTHDLYWSLALQFVILMDVLQSIRCNINLLPLEAYEQWEELGSQRALKMLRSYTQGIPFKHIQR